MMKVTFLTLLLVFQMNTSLLYGVSLKTIQKETDKLNNLTTAHTEENLLTSCKSILGGNEKYFQRHNNFKRYVSYSVIPGGSGLFAGELLLIGTGCSILMGNPAPLLLSLIPASFFIAGSLVSGIGAKLYFDQQKKNMKIKQKHRITTLSSWVTKPMTDRLDNIAKTPFADVAETTKQNITEWLKAPSNKLEGKSLEIFCRSLTYETNL